MPSSVGTQHKQPNFKSPKLPFSSQISVKATEKTIPTAEKTLTKQRKRPFVRQRQSAGVFQPLKAVTEASRRTQSIIPTPQRGNFLFYLIMSTDCGNSSKQQSISLQQLKTHSNKLLSHLNECQKNKLTLPSGASWANRSLGNNQLNMWYY